MKKSLYILYAAILTIFTQCDTLKSIPTNTSGGLFSLNGSWKMTTSTDNGAMVGTVVRVMPGVADGVARTLGNNTYCLRENDVLWRGLKAGETGTFTVENLVTACNGTIVYKPATITVLTNDEIRVAGHTSAGVELIQNFQRVPQQ